MKLISLYIENFGGLHRYALDLEKGLTVIEEANGFGKTTLAEFIRAMFYGFPRKGKTLDKSRRQKYTPWNGGKFGGNLVFELDGAQYRVERTFGATPKGDSFNLIDLSTGKKSNRFTEELGLELFQLDADSFERSTYLPQMGDAQVLTTDSIRSKLSNLVEDTNDVGNFEKAVNALRSKRSTFVPYRGNGGSVAQANSQITSLQAQLHRIEIQKNMLEEAEGNILLLQREQQTAADRRERLRSDIRLASESMAVRVVHRQHRNLMDRYETAAATCRNFAEAYPCGLPAWERIDEAGNAAAQLEILGGRTVTTRDDLDAMAFLRENARHFQGRLPAVEDLAACRNRCAEHVSVRNRIMELAAELSRQPEIGVSIIPTVLLLLLGVVGAALGVALMGREMLYGVIALGVGGLLLIAGAVAALRMTTRRKSLHQFQQKQQKIREEMDRLNAEAERLEKRIDAFLTSYGFGQRGDFYARLAELERRSETYRRAESRVAQWQREKAQHEAEVARCSDALTAFFASLGLSSQENVRKQLQQIRRDRDDWEEAVESKASLKRELAAFRQEHEETLAMAIPEDLEDLDALRREEMAVSTRLNGLGDELLRQQQRKELALAQVQQIPQLRDELQRWQEKKNADQKQSDLLDETIALLAQAKENLSGNYLGPIRKSFAQYLSKLWQDQEGQVLVTPDLDVQLERFGQARELGYFSAGQADMVMLGMRFALVDALFGGEKPFVILDDPFINLDDDHTAQALDLLKTLSQDRQIIYLTCNSSRSPK